MNIDEQREMWHERIGKMADQEILPMFDGWSVSRNGSAWLFHKSGEKSHYAPTPDDATLICNCLVGIAYYKAARIALAQTNTATTCREYVDG